MWGKGEPRTQSMVLAIESAVANSHLELCRGLEAADMKQEAEKLLLSMKRYRIERNRGSLVKTNG